MTVEIRILGGPEAIQGQLDEVLRELQQRFGSRSKVLSRTLNTAIDDWGLTILEPEVQKNLAGLRLRRRTGQLANRTRVNTAIRPVEGRDSLKVSVEIQSTDVPYARIQEFGGTIRPQEKQFLTIPLPAALTPAGVLRNTAEQLRETGRTFIAKSRQGNLIIFQRRGRGSRTRAGQEADITPLFVLLKRVQIPASKWASSAVDATLPKLPDFIRDAIEGIG